MQCYIENNVVFSNNVTLGGNTHIMRDAQLGFNTIVHQNQVIGPRPKLDIPRSSRFKETDWQIVPWEIHFQNTFQVLVNCNVKMLHKFDRS